MDQIAMAFSPAVLVVRPGQEVEFRNSEDVDHGVRLRSTDSDSTLFNEGTTMGQPVRFRFDAPGGYAVSCDLHPGMSAFILVAPSAYAAVARADGEFTLRGVPPGRYRATVWSLGPSPRTERVVEIAPGRTTLRLDVIP
jgi:hypothetical protein